MKAMQCSFLMIKMSPSVCVRAKQSDYAEVASHTCDVGWRAQDDDVAQQACIVAGDGDGGL